MIEKKLFLRSFFSIKLFRCTLRLQFWPARGFLFVAGRNVSARCRKLMEKVLFFFRKKQFSSKLSYGHVGCIFDEPAEKFSTKRPHFYRWMAKEKIFFQKKNSWQCFDGHVKYCFDNPADFFFGKKRKTFRSMSGSDWKKFFFFQKKLFFRKNLFRHLGCTFDNPTERSST